jgi:hypothetical protein
VFDMKGTECYKNDTCSRDPECPFVRGCISAEDTDILPALNEASEQTVGHAPTRPDALYLVPPALLADLGQEYGIARRIAIGPAVRQTRHRCLFCWLVAFLPDHHRCPHGRLDCEQCELEAEGW